MMITVALLAIVAVAGIWLVERVFNMKIITP